MIWLVRFFISNVFINFMMVFFLYLFIDWFLIKIELDVIDEKKNKERRRINF